MAGASSAMSSGAARAGELRAVATELERENGEGREVARLTVVATVQTAWSGMSRGGGGDLVVRRSKTSSVETLGGLRRGVAR